MFPDILNFHLHILLQQLFGDLHAVVRQILDKRHASFRLEELGKIEGAEIDLSGDIAQRDHGAVVFLDEGDGLADQIVGIVLLHVPQVFEAAIDVGDAPVMNGDGVIHIFEPQIAGILDSFFDAEARQAD